MNKVVAIKELMWTYHPLPKNWITVPFEDKETINSADVLVQSNQSGSKKEKKIGHIYKYVRDTGKSFIVTESAVFRKNMPNQFNHVHQIPLDKLFSKTKATIVMKIVLVIDGNKSQRSKDLQSKDWRKKGDYVLVMLQRPGDSSLVNLLKKHGTYEGFVTHTLKEIKQNTDRSIRVSMQSFKTR